MKKIVNQIPIPCFALGFAGLIPFWFVALGYWFLDAENKELALNAQINYGAIILSFLGASHWGLAIADRRLATWPRMIWGVSPSLIGWSATFLEPFFAYQVLLAGLSFAFFVDCKIFRMQEDWNWYQRLRVWLTLGAISSILVCFIGVFFQFKI